MFGARLAIWIVAIGALLGAGIAAMNGRWTEYGQLVVALAFCGVALAVATAGVWGMMHVLASRQS